MTLSELAAPEETTIRGLSRLTHARKGRRRNSTRTVLLLPALTVFTVVVMLPVLVNLFYAFTDWNGLNPSFNFVGVENFARLFRDENFIRAFINTLLFTAINAPLQVGVALLLAVTLQGLGRIRRLLRLIIVLPIAISGVVLGFIGTLIFDPRSGLLNALSTLPGLGFADQNWLGSPQYAMAAVIFMNVWQWSGFTMLIFIAGLTTIPLELYEAATLDGANAWQRFSRITWPLLAPAATVSIVLTVIGGLKVFDIIYVLTGGGPGRATETVVFQVVKQGAFGNFAYSAATSLVLTIVITAISIALLAFLRRRELRA